MRKQSFLNSEEEIEEEPNLNLTSLIDVVFVILICFIISAPLISMDSIVLASRKKSNEGGLPVANRDSFPIYILSDNSIWLREEQILLTDLFNRLTLEKKKSPHITPQVIPHAHSHFEIYQEIKNILELAGFEYLDVVLSSV